MRDDPGARNLLAREDEGYVVGVIGRDGQHLPGKAAKWHASERLMGWMEEMLQGEEMVVDDEQDLEEKSILVECGGPEQEQKKREEESILYGCKDQEQEDGEQGRNFYRRNAWKQDREGEESILYGRNPSRPPYPP
jgi:hypothetical protein